MCRGYGSALMAMAMAWVVGCSTSSGDGQVIRSGLAEIRVSAAAIGGPATRGDWASAKAEPHVECGVEDVRSDDLGSQLVRGVPQEGWETLQSDEEDRCGDDFETLLFRVANCEREARSLPPLACDLRLVWEGRGHSADMERRGYFDHVTPEGLSPHERLDARGVEWTTVAENIAQAPTMALAHTAWMESRGHRENVTGTHVTHMGVGVVKGERGYMITALFLALR